MFLQETGCSISAAHLCTWCVQAPNNYIEQNTPCIWLILAAPMSEEGYVPDTIMIIIHIMLIIGNKRKNQFSKVFSPHGYSCSKDRTEVNTIHESSVDHLAKISIKYLMLGMYI
jgi:hypothetical protein